MKYQELGFRGAYHNVLGFTLEEEMRREFEGFPGNKEANIVVGYGFIDHEQGVGFEVLCLGLKQNGKMEFFHGNPEIRKQVYIGTCLDCDFTYIDPKDLRDSYTERMNQVDEAYKVSDALEAIRCKEELDSLRATENPDEFMVTLARLGLADETIYLRAEGMNDDLLKGIVVTQPYQEGFDVLYNDWIAVHIVKDGDTIHLIQ